MASLAAAAPNVAERPHARSWKAYAAAALLWAAAALAITVPMAAGVQMAILLLGLVAVGAPHGIFDIDVALWAAPLRRRRLWLAGLLAAYLALIAAVAAGWAWAPGATLCGFLLASVAHFGFEGIPLSGVDDPLRRNVGAVVRGGAVILGPALLHGGVVDPLFAALGGTTPQVVRAIVTAAAPWLAAAWLAGLAFTLQGARRRGAVAEIAELLGLAALFAFAPPLFAFAVYFCGLHALRHARAMARLSGAAQAWPRTIWAARRMAPMAGALGVGLAVAMVAPLGWARTPVDAVVWSFRLLAALTLPHLLLTPALERRAAARRDAHGG